MFKKQLWYGVGACFLTVHGMDASDRPKAVGNIRVYYTAWGDAFRMVQFGYAKIGWVQQECTALDSMLKDETLTSYERADREKRRCECAKDIQSLEFLIKSIMDHRRERTVSVETGHWVAGIMDCGPKL